MFEDEIRVTVRAGKGGDGLVAFRREKYVPKGGPSGGDGGDGGDVVLVAAPEVHGFRGLRGRKVLRAGNGRPGGVNQRGGRDAENLVVEVPVGTQVRDAATGVLLKDLVAPGAEVRIVKGGKGGRGNARFAHATRQTPRFAEKGTEGESRALVLTVKLIADAGLVGLPNAGKSTLLRSLSRSKTKVSGYEFTTLGPHLGVVEVSTSLRITFADLPGLIEGAHEGRGLGDKFLRHVERTRVVVHVVAHDPTGSSPPADQAWRTVRGELGAYSGELAGKPEILVLSKCDLPGWEESRDLLARTAGAEVTAISAVTGAGMDALLRRVVAATASGAAE
jgi:GTP-binding protein